MFLFFNQFRFDVCKSMLGIIVLLSLAACAPAQKERARYFFPPPPVEPKIEYIRTIQSDHDVTQLEVNWLEDAILGRTMPYSLFRSPVDVASDGRGRIMVSDMVLRQVLIADYNKQQIRYFKEKNGKQVRYSSPFAVAFGKKGEAVVSDIVNKNLYLFGPNEILISKIKLDEVSRPVGVEIDSENRLIYVADTGQHRLMVFGFNGELLSVFGKRGDGPGEYNFPLDVSLGPDGNLYVLDALNYRVQVISPSGEYLRSFGEQGTATGSFRMPKGIGVGPSGQVYVSDALSHRYVVFDTQGNYLLSVGGKQRYRDFVAPGGFYLPRGLDVDDNDTIWVVDSLNRSVQKFQYLNDEYLDRNPLLPGQSALPTN